jgi:hypothetical protein
VKKSLVAAAIALVSACLAFPAGAGAAVLYDQNNSPGTGGSTSQVGSAIPEPIDLQTADDFTVPAGQQWTIQDVNVTGQYENGSGPVPAVNVFIYSDSGGAPGARVFGGTVPVANGSGPSFLIGLGGGVPLSPGHYWLSFQAQLDNFPLEIWDWKNRKAVSGSPAMFQTNAGNQLTGCHPWMPRTTTGVCPGFESEPDQMFSLGGTSAPVSTAPGPVTTAPPAATKKKCKKKKRHAAAAKKKKCKKKKKKKR